MQIEENFRDIKNERLGIGLRRNQSQGLTRITVLFFLASILILLLWWFGLIIETAGRHRKYQASSKKNKRIVSLVRLGRMALRDEIHLITLERLQEVIALLCEQYSNFLEVGILECAKK